MPPLAHPAASADQPDRAADGGLDEAIALAAVRVFALDGRPVRLREAFGGRPTVLALVRQFGCLFCHELVAELEARVDAFTAAGAHVVVVGPGTVEQANRFVRGRGLDPRLAVHADPQLEAFRAARLQRSYARTFLDGRAHDAHARARAAGHAIRGAHGDVPQLSGLFVVRPPAEFVFSHRAAFAGDHPDLDQVLAAVRLTRGAR